MADAFITSVVTSSVLEVLLKAIIIILNNKLGKLNQSEDDTLLVEGEIIYLFLISQ